MPALSLPDAEHRRGLVAGAAAFAFWGLAPLYWKLLDHLDPLEMVAHRTVWSAVFLILVLAATGSGRSILETVRSPYLLSRLTLSALLIAANWFLYIYAVTNERILEASLGYFTNPIVSVLLGVALLGERLSTRRKLAVALAVVAVVLLAVRTGVTPWISIGLASSFGLYGLMRKTIAVAGATGLAVEALVLSPLCLVFLGWRHHLGLAAFSPAEPVDAVLLIFTGVVTALPLWWFAAAARRLPLSTVGMLQYLAPSLQFLLAVFLYREPFDSVRLAAFALIWLACILFSWPRRQQPAPVVLPPPA